MEKLYFEKECFPIPAMSSSVNRRAYLSYLLARTWASGDLQCTDTRPEGSSITQKPTPAWVMTYKDCVPGQPAEILASRRGTPLQQLLPFNLGAGPWESCKF